MSNADHRPNLLDVLRDEGLDGLVRALAGDAGLHRALIRYGRATLVAAASDEVALIWARMYLEPILDLEPAPEGEPARFAAVFVPGDVLGDLVAALPWDGGERLIHFAKTARVAHIPGYTCVHDTVSAMLYLVEAATGRVVSIGAATGVNFRDLARQCRELLLGDLLADGWLVLHASAVARDGRAWIFAGDKGSGKTTLALKLLGADLGFGYLANDRLLARVNADGAVQIKPYAMSVRLGGATARNHPRLRPHLHYFDHFEASILPLERQFIHEDKLELTVGEYASIVGFDVAGEAVLDRVVLPTMDFTDPATEVNITAPNPQQAFDLLLGSVLIPDPDGTSWLRELTGAKDELTDAMQRTVQAMAATGAARLRGGPDAIIAALLTAHAAPTAPADAEDA